MTYSREYLEKMNAEAISRCSPKHIESVIAELISTASAQAVPDAVRYRTLRDGADIDVDGPLVMMVSANGDVRHTLTGAALDSAVDALRTSTPADDSQPAVGGAA